MIFIVWWLVPSWLPWIILWCVLGLAVDLALILWQRRAMNDRS